MVEDETHDAELVLRTMRKSGLVVESVCVDSESRFRQVLQDFAPDVILSDFSMPLFDGMSALRIARELVPDLPFIFVSGTIGEEHAINGLKSGATDYVLKGNLLRLAPAIERALKDVKKAREQRRVAQALDYSEQRFRLAASTGDVWDWHVDSGESYIPPQWKHRHGYADEELANASSTWFELLHPDDVPGVQKALDAHLIENTPYEVEFRTQQRNGGHRWSQVKGMALRDAQGQPTYMAGTIVDITERKNAELRVSRLNRVYALQSAIGSLIIRVQSRKELFREACRIAVETAGFLYVWVALADSGALPAATPGLEALQEGALPDDVAHAAQERLLAGLVRDVALSGESRFEEDLSKHHPELSVSHAVAALPLLVQQRVEGVLVLHAAGLSFFDADERRLLGEMANDLSFALDHIGKSEQLNYVAFYDALTGLANRSLFMEHLTRHLDVARREQRKLAVLALNVDRFKTVNDSLGFAGGDELLKQLAQRLRDYATASGQIARIDADHFAIVVPEIRTEQGLARSIEQGMGACFGEPFEVAGTELRMSACTGISVFPHDGDGADVLYRHALSAAGKARSRGERYLFYSQDMSEKIAGTLALEMRLRRAILNEEFVMYYQPKVEAGTWQWSGVEALIRWNDPEHGLVAPGEFIPLLEETGLIREVGAWALQQAVRDQLRWKALGIRSAPRVAVNVSAIQLRRGDFVATVRDAIKLGSQPPSLDIEITESIVMDDIETNIARLNEVRELGVGIAVDDFGTGYSSLRYLAQLPAQTLKIDRAFVSTMLLEPNTMTLVSTVISLAHSLKLKVVAEGVETEKQAQWLRRLRCDEMQGYWFSRPMSFERMSEMLKQALGDAA
jgi:diguanylate cyclase (GGDEF)-like protein/PAS domain S-box-containing protein